MTPWAPKRACRVCRRLGCTIPSHQPKPRTRTGSTVERRPDYNSSKERRRREQTVAEWLVVHGRQCASGDVIARCPDCGQMRARFIADHVVPIADGGREDGPLAVHCATCSGRQGAALAARRKRERF